MKLFFVSTFGHIFHAHNTIEMLGLSKEEVMFIITYSKLELAEKTQGKLYELGYRNIRLCEVRLPRLTLRSKKYDLVYNALDKMVCDFNTKEIYMCAYEFYYAMIYRIGFEKNIPINLFEEGLGTYKYLIKEHNKNGYIKMFFIAIYTVFINNIVTTISAIIKTSIKLVKRIFKQTLHFIKSIFKAIFKCIIAYLKIVKRMITIIIRFPKIYFSYLSDLERKKICQFILPKKYKYINSFYRDYDNFYLIYPQKGEKIFSAKNKVQLDLKYEITEEEKIVMENSNLTNMDENTCIFINQAPYISSIEQHIQTVLSYIREKEYNNIYIKLHPRESNIIETKFKNKAYEMGLNIEIIDSKINIPMEKIILYKKPKKIIGLASTTLLYTKYLAPEVEIELCGRYYIEKK